MGMYESYVNQSDNKKPPAHLYVLDISMHPVKLLDELVGQVLHESATLGLHLGRVIETTDVVDGRRAWKDNRGFEL